jgi:hypothetical protein
MDPLQMIVIFCTSMFGSAFGTLVGGSSLIMAVKLLMDA